MTDFKILFLSYEDSDSFSLLIIHSFHVAFILLLGILKNASISIIFLSLAYLISFTKPRDKFIDYVNSLNELLMIRLNLAFIVFPQLASATQRRNIIVSFLEITATASSFKSLHFQHHKRRSLQKWY